MADNYRVYDFSSRRITTSHHVSFDKSIFPCRVQNPDPWLPEDFLDQPRTTVVPCVPNPLTPQLEIVHSDDVQTEEAAEGETTGAVEENHPSCGPPVIITDDAQQSTPRNLSLSENVGCLSPDTPSTTPVIRSSVRLRGAIPSYKGMAADWTEENLTNCFNILPSTFGGSVINSPVP